MLISPGKKRIFDVVTSMIGLFAAAFGAWFAYNQFKSSVEKDKVAYAVEFSRQYYSEPMIGYVNLVDNLLRKVSMDWKAISPDTNRMRLQSQRDLAVAHELDERTADPALGIAVRRVLDFYGQVTVCANSGVCSKIAIQELFQDTADHVLSMLRPYICEERSRWNYWDFEAAAEQLLERAKPRPHECSRVASIEPESSSLSDR
jgi:hypothetical protein